MQAPQSPIECRGNQQGDDKPPRKTQEQPCFVAGQVDPLPSAKEQGEAVKIEAHFVGAGHETVKNAPRSADVAGNRAGFAPSDADVEAAGIDADGESDSAAPPRPRGFSEIAAE